MLTYTHVVYLMVWMHYGISFIAIRSAPSLNITNMDSLLMVTSPVDAGAELHRPAAFGHTDVAGIHFAALDPE